MGLYRMGSQTVIGADDRPLININAAKTGDTFWTAVKWIGAGLVLVTGYREAKTFWQRNLYGSEGGEE
jgi:hypothetical protein